MNKGCESRQDQNGKDCEQYWGADKTRAWCRSCLSFCRGGRPNDGLRDTPSYDDRLAAFVSHILAIQSFPCPAVTVHSGRKFDRVVLSNPHASAFCFVRKSDGDVMKTKNWKGPAKHPRGTIFTDDPTKYGVDEYGAVYLA